jgi:hypothetical protein
MLGLNVLRLRLRLVLGLKLGVGLKLKLPLALKLSDALGPDGLRLGDSDGETLGLSDEIGHSCLMSIAPYFLANCQTVETVSNPPDMTVTICVP